MESIKSQQAVIMQRQFVLVLALLAVVGFSLGLVVPGRDVDLHTNVMPGLYLGMRF